MALMTFGRASLFSCLSSCREPLGAAQRHGSAFHAEKFLVQILQPIHFDVAQMIERIAGGARAGHGRVVGDPSGDRLAANRPRFAHRLLAFGGVDDQRHFVIFYHIDDVRATLPHLVDPAADDAGLLQRRRGAARWPRSRSRGRSASAPAAPRRACPGRAR